MRLSIFFLLALLSLFGWASSASAGPDPTLSSSYYSHINAPCAGGSCSALRQQLDRLQSGECERIETRCEPATEILKMLFGDGHRPNLPDFVVYFRQDQGKFIGKPRGVLMWRGMNTPHLFGARDVYALVFSEKPICMDAFITVDFKSEPNPLTGIFAAIGGKTDDAKAAPSTHALVNFTWYPMSGNRADSELWMGLARMSVDVNSIDRLNIQYKQPVQAGAKDVPEECTQGGDRPKAFTGEFASANAFFSNSPDSAVGVSIALGMTRNPKDTSVSAGDGSKEYFNGYAFAKYYVRRPRLRAGPDADPASRDVSFALVLGTNVTKSTFSEIVYGVSVGHIVGNMGLVAGVNSLQGAKDSSTGRKSRPFLALEYSF
jgi:hypothetical protein